VVYVSCSCSPSLCSSACCSAILLFSSACFVFNCCCSATCAGVSTMGLLGGLSYLSGELWFTIGDCGTGRYLSGAASTCRLSFGSLSTTPGAGNFGSEVTEYASVWSVFCSSYDMSSDIPAMLSDCLSCFLFCDNSDCLYAGCPTLETGLSEVFSWLIRLDEANPVLSDPQRELLLDQVGDPDLKE